MGKFLDFFRRKKPKALPSEALAEISLQSLVSTRQQSRAYAQQRWDGEKFVGGIFDVAGYGFTQWTDYTVLRARSEDVFKTNLYARGLIRRLVDNEVHTGLSLEATPVESVLNFDEAELDDWTDEVERLFELWAEDATICDHRRRQTFGELQALVRRESLIGGDCLVVLRTDPETRLPTVEVVGASSIGGVSNDAIPDTHRVEHGVEIDESGRHVAFHVWRYNGSSRETARIPAFDPNGRRRAWMVYGSDMRVDTVRGEPLLSIVLQSIKEIDKYRDSAQRKATINSLLAVFMRKTQDKMGSGALTSAATRISTVTPEDGDTGGREWSILDQVPGVVLQELQTGEEPVGFGNQGIDTAFPEFEAAIAAAVAWVNGIPPEIYVLAFRNNYSASQAALNEFRMVLELRRVDSGRNLLSPIYREWLIDAVQARMVKADSLVMAVGRRDRFQIVAAWTSADWSGAVKPTTDMLKAVRAYNEATETGLMDHTYATRLLTGRNWAKNVKRLKRENAALAEALAPMRELETPAAPPAENDGQDVDGEDEENDGDNPDEVAT